MSQKNRIFAGVLILVLISAIVLGVEYLRGQSSVPAAGTVTLTPGSVPVYLNGDLVAGIQPASLESLDKVSFVDAEEGKPQDGWLLRDVLLQYLPEQSLGDSQITVSSSSREKSVTLTWKEVDNRDNMVMFDLSNRGTLKLVSLLEKLDMRDEWVQDVDKIEVAQP